MSLTRHSANDEEATDSLKEDLMLIKSQATYWKGEYGGK